MPACICRTLGCLPVPVYTDALLNECPVSSSILIHSWFLLRLNNSPAFISACYYVLTYLSVVLLKAYHIVSKIVKIMYI
jgi:hypothetical protein